MQAEQETDPVAYHGEGPVWSERWGGLRWVDMLAGDLPAAEEVLRNGYRQLEEMGGTGPRVNVATLLARVRLQRNRNDDAE